MSRIILVTALAIAGLAVAPSASAQGGITPSSRDNRQAIYQTRAHVQTLRARKCLSRYPVQYANVWKIPAPKVKPILRTWQGREQVARHARSACPRAVGRSMAAERGWTGYQWEALEEVFQRESKWSPMARNPSSGACGIPQANIAGPGCPFPLSRAPAVVRRQIAWGIRYIARRYGTPAVALGRHDARGWY